VKTGYICLNIFFAVINKNKRLLCALLVVLLFTLSAANGQPAKFTLRGIAKTDGLIYRYTVSFTVAGNTLSGNSATVQPGGRVMNTDVRGTIDRKAHTFSFMEIPSSGSSFTHQFRDSFSCYFYAKLSYRLVDSQYLVTGTFSGKRENGQPCCKGIMLLTQPDVPNSPFRQPKKEIHRPVPHIKDSAKSLPPPPADSSLITEGYDKKIEWHSDKCLIEIWDGGLVDGDIVTIRLNGKDVLADFSLTAEKKQLWVELTQKINTISVLAVSEGTAPPNTAQIAVTDGAEQYKLTAYNKKGKIANIVIVRK
jgi:hypothetical protein